MNDDADPDAHEEAIAVGLGAQEVEVAERRAGLLKFERGLDPARRWCAGQQTHGGDYRRGTGRTEPSRRGQARRRGRRLRGRSRGSRAPRRSGLGRTASAAIRACKVLVSVHARLKAEEPGGGKEGRENEPTHTNHSDASWMSDASPCRSDGRRQLQLLSKNADPYVHHAAVTAPTQ